MADIHREKILILDFGSQYTQLIARRVRECHVYCELHPFDMSLDEIKAFGAQGIILSGGPKSVYEEGAPAITEELLELGIPILGICYGMQLICRHFGGEVVPAGEARLSSEVTRELVRPHRAVVHSLAGGDAHRPIPSSA